jgi:hypothetical protein
MSIKLLLLRAFFNEAQLRRDLGGTLRAPVAIESQLIRLTPETPHPPFQLIYQNTVLRGAA